MATQPVLDEGKLIGGDFRVVRPLGRGGMGAVYVAEQLSTGRERALKVMAASLVRDAGMRRRFEQEAKVGSRIKSDHVVEVIAAGVDAESGAPWIAMELLEGEDLETRVRREGLLELGTARELLAELCHGLGAAHEAGVVHRDLKPENVFLARTHRKGAELAVKLLDLGISKLVAESAAETAAIGTPLWMAPEQTGGKIGPPTDVWALGLLAFWMLTGKHYWRAANDPTGAISLMGVLKEIAADDIEPASVRAREYGVEGRLPLGFDAWFAQTVTRDPAQRFADAHRAHVELERCLVGAAATLELPRGATGPAPLPEPTPSAPEGATATTEPRVQTGPAPQGGRRWAILAALSLLGLGALALRAGGRPADASPAPSTSPSPPASALPAPSASAGGETPDASAAVDHADSAAVWKIPIGDSPVRGPAEAQVTIVEFGNFQCPFSKAVSAKLRALVDEHPGKVRLVWKDDPLAIHFRAEAAAQVAREARARGGNEAFWRAHDLLIDPELKPTPEALERAAKTLGLPAGEVARLEKERRYADSIGRDADLADDFAVLGTPYFFVNGRRAIATQSLDKLREIVSAELERTGALLAQGTPIAGLYERITAAGRTGLPLDVRPFAVLPATAPGRGAPDSGAFLIELASYTDFKSRLVQSTVDQLLATHQKALGMAWLDLPEASEESRHAALLARAVYRELGEDQWVKVQPLLFAKQLEPGGLTRTRADLAARSVGLDGKVLVQRMADVSLAAEMESDAGLARSLGLKEGPAFLICRSAYCEGGAYFLSYGHPARAFERRIRLVLEHRKGPLPRTGQ